MELLSVHTLVDKKLSQKCAARPHQRSDLKTLGVKRLSKAKVAVAKKNDQLQAAITSLHQRLETAKSMNGEREIRQYCVKLTDQVRLQIKASMQALKRLEDDLTHKIDAYESNRIESYRASKNDQVSTTAKKRIELDKLVKEITELEKTSNRYLASQSPEFLVEKAVQYSNMLEQSVQDYRDSVFENSYLRFNKGKMLVRSASGLFSSFHFCTKGNERVDF